MSEEIVVHGSRISPFVEKVVRGAALKGLPFRLAERPPRRVWRTGKVPAVRIGETWHEDSTFILRAFDALQPDPPLLSSDPVVAAAQRNLEDWSDESLYWCVFAIRWSSPNADATRAQLSSLRGPLPRFLFDLWMRRSVGRQPSAQGMGRLPYEVLLRETGGRLDDLVTLLGARPFFYAKRPSVADLAIYGQLRTGCSTATPDLHDLIHQRPALTAFMKRLEECTEGAGA
ncbi:MAG: glutathione S-transferase family protein [Myxococcota bacterium]